MKYMGIIKYFMMALIVGVIAAFMIFGCSSDTGRNVTNATRIDRDRDSGSRTTTSSLDCALPSGSGCQGDQDCEEICKDDDYLDLSGKAKDECFDLSVSTVEKLDAIFEVLKDPDEDDLEALTEEDVNLLCGAIEELDDDFWLREIKNYSSSDVQHIMRWIIDNQQVTTLINKELSSEDGKAHLTHLISILGGSRNVSDDTLLKGLKKDIDTDDDFTILEYADDNSNDEFVEMIHDLIVDETICTVAGNQPGGVTPADDSFPLAACMLGVYCESAEKDARSGIADVLGVGDINGLISTDVSDAGGLNGTGNAATSEKDEEEWTDFACGRLATIWSNGNLDLGLD